MIMTECTSRLSSVPSCHILFKHTCLHSQRCIHGHEQLSLQMQEAHDTLQCMRSMYCLPDDPAGVASSLSLPAPQTPTSTASTPRASHAPQPLPCSSVPANDPSCLPTGFSPVPATAAASGPALAEVLDSPMSSPARKVIDTTGEPSATTPRALAAVPLASDRPTPLNTPSKLTTAATPATGINLKQLPLPEGLQSMSLSDVTILHSWLRGRLELASGRCDAALRWFTVLDRSARCGTVQPQVQRASLLLVSSADTTDTEASSAEGLSKAASAVDVAAFATPAAAAADAAVGAIGSLMPSLCSDAEVCSCPAKALLVM